MPSSVFVVHGRNELVRSETYTFLRALGLTPMSWSDAVAATELPNPFIWDVVNLGLTAAQAAVVLLSGEDEGRIRSRWAEPGETLEWVSQARQNVIFETGVAFGRYHKKVVLVQFGEVRPLSDLAGIRLLKYDPGTKDAVFRQEFRAALRNASCDVNNDPGFLTSGDFATALQSTLPGVTPRVAFNAGVSRAMHLADPKSYSFHVENSLSNFFGKLEVDWNDHKSRTSFSIADANWSQAGHHRAFLKEWYELGCVMGALTRVPGRKLRSTVFDHAKALCTRLNVTSRFPDNVPPSPAEAGNWLAIEALRDAAER
jgi:hypothetical protein